jgi:uncharacterized protein YlaI
MLSLIWYCCCCNTATEKDEQQDVSKQPQEQAKRPITQYMCSSSDEMLTEDELWDEDVLVPSFYAIPVESQSTPSFV